MKDLIVDDDVSALCFAVSDLVELMKAQLRSCFHCGGLLLKLLVNLEICYSSFKCSPRGDLHEILGLRATGDFSMCVGV